MTLENQTNRFNEAIAQAETDIRQGPGFEVLLLAELRMLKSTLLHRRPTAVAARLLGVKAAAHYLGATTWSIRKLAWDKEVPHVRIGQRMLFDIKDLDAFIERVKA